MNRTFILAEAGVNHNGSLDRAFQLVELSAASGADAVKFQTFEAEKLAAKNSELADYQKTAGLSYSSQKEMLKNLELSKAEFSSLIKYANELSVEFVSTPFDLNSLHFLVQSGVKRLKISSGEMFNPFMVWTSASSQIPVILSTGMASMAEVEFAVALFCLGAAGLPFPKSVEEVLSIYADPKVQELARGRLTLLHCTSLYPTPFDKANLLAIPSMAKFFKIPVGFSDHTLGSKAAVLSVGLGATVIEKHFTMDKNLPGPDHKASLDPKEFKDFVKSIRDSERLLGNGLKFPAKEELEQRPLVEKKVHANRQIQIGEEITVDMVEALRGQNGRPISDVFDLLGKPSNSKYLAGEPIE